MSERTLIAATAALCLVGLVAISVLSPYDNMAPSAQSRFVVPRTYMTTSRPSAPSALTRRNPNIIIPQPQIAPKPRGMVPIQAAHSSGLQPASKFIPVVVEPAKHHISRADLGLEERRGKYENRREFGVDEFSVFGSGRVTGLKFATHSVQSPRKNMMDDRYAVIQNIQSLRPSNPLKAGAGPKLFLLSKFDLERRRRSWIKYPDSTYMFTVVDGHNGWQAASFVTNQLGPTLRNHPDFYDDLSNALRESFHALDNLYYGHILEEKIPQRIGASAVSVVIREGMLHCASAGVTRALIVKQKGASTKPSRTRLGADEDSHELDEDTAELMANYPFADYDWSASSGYEVVEITPAHDAREVKPSNDDEVCSDAVQGFGNFPCKSHITVDPVMSSIELSPSDRFLVLGTQGLWNVITSAEVGGVIHTVGPHPHTIVLALTSLAKARSTDQDLSVIVIDLAAYQAATITGALPGSRYQKWTMQMPDPRDVRKPSE